jgi:hypothetical protein
MAVNRLNVGATNQLLAKASTGQSTNILELQNTAGVTVAGVDASGNGVGGLAHPPTFKNLIINGAMQVAQRGTSVTGISSTSQYYTVDRWKLGPSSMGTWTISQENDAPTGSGFRKSTKILCTTADASPAANDHIVFVTVLEGQNLQQIAKGTSSAKQLTLSFWVKANVTGTYIANIYDADNTRWCSASYTVSSSATWEKKTITLPADTTGAFDNDNAGSLILHMFLGAGTGLSGGTLGTTWRSADFINSDIAAGQTNVAASTNNYWQITGVQLEVGSVATEFEFLSMDEDIRKCQRYYQKSYNIDVVPGTSTLVGALGMAIFEPGGNFDQLSVYASLKPTMRGTPTVTAYATDGTINRMSNSLSTVNNNGGAANTALIGANGFVIYNTAGNDQNNIIAHYTASAEL